MQFFNVEYTGVLQNSQSLNDCPYLPEAEKQTPNQGKIWKLKHKNYVNPVKFSKLNLDSN